MVDLVRLARGCLLAGSILAAACERSPSPFEPPAVPPPAPPIQPASQIAVAGLDGILLINADGSGALLGTDRGRDPSWSPDGTKLVYSTTECETDWESYYKCEKGGLVIMDVASRVTTVPSSGFIGEQPAWSPLGNEIAFSRYTPVGNRLFIMKLDGSVATPVATTGVNNAFAPAWSPDGGRLAFFGSGGHNGVCIVNRDGTGQTCINVPGISPAWSPDGSKFAVAGTATGQMAVTTMNIDGTGYVTLSPGLVPAWSKDGKQLAFSRNNDGVYVMNADGTNRRQIALGIFGRPAWRPTQ